FMKKILTTILAGTLVAGAAFAADAKISVGFRTGLDAFSLKNGKNTEKTKDGTAWRDDNRRDWMDWNGYAGGLAKDDLKINMSGDMFGATLAVTAKANSGTSPFELKQLSGWMKFNVGPGTLQLDAGNWGDFVQTSFRVNKDGGIKEGLDFETSKLGSIFNVGNINFVDDLTSGNGKKSIGGFASYGLDVAEGVNLKVTVGGVQNDKFDSVTDTEDNGDSTTTTWKSAFASNVLLKVKGIADVKFVYKLNHTEDKNLSNTFALYVMPQILDALTLNVGGAVGLNGADGGDDCTDWGVDLRMRYQVMDPLSITFFTNVSGTTNDDGRKIKSGIVGNNGKQGYATARSVKVAMWNHLTGQYKINDLLTASLDVGLITPLSKIEDDKNSYSPEWRVTPAVQIFPNPESNTSLWVGVAISGASWTEKAAGQADVDKSSFCVDIPVIFRVKW
ncbi:MAG: hypothetical protein K2I74_01190, partial [Treponemataceae bacterium]|nr:hypothetical protein [Treponemataceae bacterium]